jgi:hypothetical protein
MVVDVSLVGSATTSAAKNTMVNRIAKKISVVPVAAFFFVSTPLLHFEEKRVHFFLPLFSVWSRERLVLLRLCINVL